MSEPKVDLKALREALTGCDEQLVSLLSERMRLIHQMLPKTSTC